MSEQDAHQVGTTTRQMLCAPIGAYYVWPSLQLTYPHHLACFIEREDLKIIPQCLFKKRFFLGRREASVVIDHSVELDQEGWEALGFIENMLPVEQP